VIKTVSTQLDLRSAFKVKGYDQLDLIEMRSSERGFSYDAREGFRLTKSDDFGIGVRAVVKGKVGHAYANRYKELASAVKNAIKLTKYSSTSFKLDKFGPYKKPSKIYDAKLMHRKDFDFLEQLKSLIVAARSKKCSVILAENSAAKGTVHYINSEGVDVEETSTGFGVGWDLEHRKNPCGYGVENTHFVKNISKELDRTCELAYLKSKKLAVKTASTPIVFHHYVVPDILAYSLIPSLKANLVQQGKSKLAGKLGKKVFSDKLSIVDDGLLAGGLASGSFDAEGVPCQKTTLVENGVLKSFLYDLARAKKDKTVSTGNGFRSYSSAADIAPTNFVVAKGRRDLVGEVDKGILLYSALNPHSIDFVSGDFSIGADTAFVIKKGELVGVPKKIMFSGNVYNLLAKIESLGVDQVSMAGRIAGGATAVTPSILSKCLVIGE